MQIIKQLPNQAKQFSSLSLHALLRGFHVGWIVSAGFAILIILLLSSIIAGLYLFSHHNDRLAEISEQATRKIYLTFRMRDAIRSRVDQLYLMQNTSDPFERDSMRMDFFSFAQHYISAREELVALAEHQAEKSFIQHLDDAASQVGPHNRLALQLLQRFDVDTNANQELQTAVKASIAGHIQLFKALGEMVNLQKSVYDQALKDANADYRESLVISIIVGIIAILVAISTALLVIQRATEKNRELSHQASHDALTGLANRSAFERALDWTLRETEMSESEHVLLFLDLDQFKIVNDTKGHQAGDRLLQELSQQLSNHIRRSDMIARLGGDEFGVLLRYTDPKHGEMVANHLRSIVEQFVFECEAERFKVGVSIGMTPFKQKDHFTLERLLSTADASCYAAKEAGRNRVHRSDLNTEEISQLSGEMRWASRIPEALHNNEFELHGQVMQALSGGQEPKRILVELLIRLPIKGTNAHIPPGEFLPAAERYGQMDNIDRWVVKRALDWVASLGELQHHITACINIYGKSACDPQFADFLHDTVINSDVDPKALCFEITESAAVHNIKAASDLIHKVGSLGCHFALDDFGAGVSSFSYLRHLDVDFLKIDGSFISNLERNQKDRELVKSINEIAKTLGKATIAEYVENDHIKAMLKQIGLDYAQGFGIHKPSALAKVEKRLQEENLRLTA